MNMLERCAALLSAAQADPTRRTKHYTSAVPELERIIERSTQRRIKNQELRLDARQLVLLRIWRRVTEKPGPVSPIELRMLIDGTISNALRDDSRARRRNGDPVGITAHDHLNDHDTEDRHTNRHTAPWDRHHAARYADTTADTAIDNLDEW